MTLTAVQIALLIEACIILTTEAGRTHDAAADIDTLAAAGMIEEIAAESAFAGQTAYTITEYGKREIAYRRL